MTTNRKSNFDNWLYAQTRPKHVASSLRDENQMRLEEEQLRE
jgi:hypothetical protein